MSQRRSTTQILTVAAIGWLAHRGYSCHPEIGVLPWGERRADIAAVNTKRHLIVIEVKSGWADLVTDRKMDQYLEFCNQMYLVITNGLWVSHEPKIRQLVDVNIGIATLDPKTGHLVVKRRSPNREIEATAKRDLIVRMAWRGGFSKRNTRRTRQYIPE